MKKRIIGIIGGTGNMGRWFERFFSENGHKVLIAGRKTELTYKDLAEKSDVVILSVPLEAAKRIADEIGPLLNKNKLLIDFCSLKEDILNHMMQRTSAQVFGTHPLFGPFVDSIKGQNIIICPGRGTRLLNWFEAELSAKGGVVSRMDPVIHDKHMAVVQGLTHLLAVSLGRALQKMDMSPQAAMLYSTPVFRIKLDMMGRLFAQDLDLYKKLIGENRHVRTAVEIFLAAMEEGREHLLSHENGKTDTVFLEAIRESFGTFPQDALNESNALINSLYSKVSSD